MIHSINDAHAPASYKSWLTRSALQNTSCSQRLTHSRLNSSAGKSQTFTFWSRLIPFASFVWLWMWMRGWWKDWARWEVGRNRSTAQMHRFEPGFQSYLSAPSLHSLGWGMFVCDESQLPIFNCTENDGASKRDLGATASTWLRQYNCWRILSS